MATKRFKLPVIWSAKQRRALIALLVLFVMCLCLVWARHRLWLPDPLPEQGPGAGEVVGRIDPNTADWQTLSALPEIGEKRAKAIVAYRERRSADRPGEPAFTDIEDLSSISGFGPAIRAKIEPYLMFPRANTTTTRSRNPALDEGK